MYLRALFCIVVITTSFSVSADGSVTLEPNADTYNFVSHYRIEITAPSTTVWNHLINLDSWMYDFELSLVSGSVGEEGEVRRLYSGQDFFMQVTKAVPRNVLVIANLPSTFNGEFSTGVAVVTLNEVEGRTIVDLTMSRRYEWKGEGENPMRARRESEEFNSATDATWHRFLERLRHLAEAATSAKS